MATTIAFRTLDDAGKLPDNYPIGDTRRRSSRVNREDHSTIVEVKKTKGESSRSSEN